MLLQDNMPLQRMVYACTEIDPKRLKHNALSSAEENLTLSVCFLSHREMLVVTVI